MQFDAWYLIVPVEAGITPFAAFLDFDPVLYTPDLEEIADDEDHTYKERLEELHRAYPE